MDKSSLVLVGRYSDPRIAMYIRNWDGWRDLLNWVQISGHNNRAFLLKLIKALVAFNIEQWANIPRICLNVKQGRHCWGSLLYISVVYMLIAINVSSFDAFIEFNKAIGLSFWKIVSGVNYSWKELLQMAWQPTSLPLSYITLAYTISGGLQLLARKLFGYMDTDNELKKGTNLIYLAIRSRTQRISERFLVRWFVPSVLVLVGWYCLTNAQWRIGLSLFLMAGSLFWQESLDALYQNAH